LRNTKLFSVLMTGGQWGKRKQKRHMGGKGGRVSQYKQKRGRMQARKRLISRER